ncbi:MAG TPA: hypothetical protein DCP91_03695 [Eggerthellaceae bacterium]|nr:hypothetical protein [Eggerthellaceae bacterium]
MLNRIRFKKRSYAFDLKPTSIDQASEWLVENLEEAGAEKSDRLRMRLLFEEALLNTAEHSGAEQQATAYLERRQGRYSLRLVTTGERFNPLQAGTESEQDEWSVSLFSVIDMHVHYAYSLGSNVVRLSLPRTTWNPVLKIIIAIAVGALIGIIGNVFIPDSAQEAFSETVLHPIADMWVRLLQAVSGPIIFLTALTATFGTKRIADFGGSRVSTVVRYFAISALVSVFSIACSLPFFPLDIAATEANRQVVSNTLDGILQIVPGNLVEPFSSANTPQLLLIAIATGYVLATIEPQISGLKSLVQQLNVLGLTVANYTCALVPFFVGLLLCLKIWTHDIDLLGAIWVPLVLSAVLSGVVVLAALLVTSARMRVNPMLLARKLKDPFVDALKRGTLDFTTVDDLATSCKQLLGINREFSRAILPQGLFLYMPTSTVGICVFVLFAAYTQQLEIDQAWVISAAVLAVIMAVATPPVTGANLLSFVMVFTYLAIPNDAFLDVMVFDIVFGVLCIATDQAMLQIETINQAERMGFLDAKTLRAPIANDASPRG